MLEKRLYNLFVGMLIKKGNKIKAINVFNEVLGMLYKEFNISGIYIISQIIKNVKPMINIRVKYVAGVTHRLPVLIKEKKEYSLAVKWIIQGMKLNMEKTLVKKLYKELIDLKRNSGIAFKKREDLYRLALQNRPFMRYLKKKEKFKV